MDLYVYRQTITDLQSFVRVWGIPITDISQARNLNGRNIAVYGGMGKGLPLADPSQAGLLVSGQINQAFGNWIGVNMTLDLQIRAGGPPQPGPGDRNLTLNWKQGTELKDAIKETLTTAYPGAKFKINVKDGLKLNYDQPGFYGTLPQFADYIERASQDIVDPSLVYTTKANGYQGVQVVIAPDGTFNINDGSTKESPKEIKFTDLIGQITWISSATFIVTCVMRADIIANDWIKLPHGQVAVSAASMTAFSNLRQESIFQGTYQVQEVRHVGNYKQPAGEAWTTIIKCNDTSSGGSSATPDSAPSVVSNPTGGLPG